MDTPVLCWKPAKLRANFCILTYSSYITVYRPLVTGGGKQDVGKNNKVVQKVPVLIIGHVTVIRTNQPHSYKQMVQRVYINIHLVYCKLLSFSFFPWNIHFYLLLLFCLFVFSLEFCCLLYNYGKKNSDMNKKNTFNFG